MAREISIREQFLPNSDEVTLRRVQQALSQEFLLIPLGDYRIEVHDNDYLAVCRSLQAVQRELEQPTI